MYLVKTEKSNKIHAVAWIFIFMASHPSHESAFKNEYRHEYNQFLSSF